MLNLSKRGKSVMLLTKEQTQKVMLAWGCTEPIPPKGQKVWIAFPIWAEWPIVTVTLDHRKSAYDKPLYRIVFSKKL